MRSVYGNREITSEEAGNEFCLQAAASRVGRVMRRTSCPGAELPHETDSLYIVPFAPGGGVDLIARTIAQKLNDSWGQSVVVDNRGGGGNIGTDMVHVPYKGAGPALIDLIGGQIDLTFTTPAGPLPFIRSGRLRVLAVTSSTRTDIVPGTPTVAEAGIPGYEVTGWYGVLAPAGTPKELVNRLNAEMVRILRLPEIKEKLAHEGLQPVGNTPEEFTIYIRNETAKWSKAVQITGVKAN